MNLKELIEKLKEVADRTDVEPELVEVDFLDLDGNVCTVSSISDLYTSSGHLILYLEDI